MTLSAHKALFPLVVLAALIGFGWILIVYVISFHAAQWAIDRIEDSATPRRARFRAIPVRTLRRAPVRFARHANFTYR